MNTDPHILDPATPAERVDFNELLQSARRIGALVRERARQTERDRRVSAEVTRLLQRAGLFRAVQPRRFGGHEFSLEQLRQLAFEVGQGCASTGWCYGLSAANAWTLGMFPLQAQVDVWGQDADSTDRTVDTHIKTLRAKLREAGAPAELIVTHRGLGYGIDPALM